MKQNKKDENYARERIANSPLKVNKTEVILEVGIFTDIKSELVTNGTSLPKSDS